MVKVGDFSVILKDFVLKIHFKKNRSKSKIRKSSNSFDVQTCVWHRWEHSQSMGPVVEKSEKNTRLKFWGHVKKIAFSDVFSWFFNFQIFISRGSKNFFLQFFVQSFRAMSRYISAVFSDSLVIFAAGHCHICENPQNTLLRPLLEKLKFSKILKIWNFFLLFKRVRSKIFEWAQVFLVRFWSRWDFSHRPSIRTL